jgi:predicted RND superfamily exporter protein
LTRKLIDPEAWAGRLVEAQIATPWRFLLAALAFTVLMGTLAAGLSFDSSYEALLPEGSPELARTDAVRARTGGFRQLVVAIEGDDPDARVAFGQALVERIRGVDGVRAAELELPVAFFAERGIWLMEPEAIDKLVVAVHRAVQATTFPFGGTDPHTAWQRVEDLVDQQKGRLPFEGSVLHSDDGRFTFLLVVPTIKFSDMQAGLDLLTAIDGQVASLDPGSAGIGVRYAGNLAVVQEQQRVMQADLRRASVVALLFGVGVLWVATRRWLAPVVVGGALLCGVGWTFGLARLGIGQLNVITGMLVAVLIGLGIDFGIHLFVRYQQERIGGGPAAEAVRRAVRGTLPPALTGALTTAGTFFSFTLARFRGFSEFGLVAGAGVLLTMISVFLVLPPLLLLLDQRLRPPTAPQRPPPRGGIPPALAWPLVLVMLAAALYGAAGVGEVPFRNDYKLLRGESPATEFLQYVDAQLGAGFNPALFLVEDPDAARELERLALALKREGLPDGRLSRLGRVLSAADLIPADIERHREGIAKLAAVVGHPSLDRYAAVDDAKGQRLRVARAMVASQPWGIEDLPEAIARRFVTPAGDALLVYVWPSEPSWADWQAAAWEDELNLLSARLDEAGIPHQVADETLIIAWVYRIIRADGPRLLALACLVVVAFLLVDFRSLRATALVAFPLAIGMLAFVGLLRVTGMEINMFNLIVLPSLIGIGIDNAVHIFHRYREEGTGSLALVVRRTGMAAFLASVTTAVGFGSSLVSHHQGLRTMGWLAILGIACTFVAATLFFPAFLSLRERSILRQHGRDPDAL